MRTSLASLFTLLVTLACFRQSDCPGQVAQTVRHRHSRAISARPSFAGVPGQGRAKVQVATTSFSRI